MLVSNNAYLILGISLDSSDSIITKRYKEQLNLISIDEVPHYQNDIKFIDYGKIRTFQNIKEAFHNLTDQNIRLKQFFFWFDIADGKDGEYFAFFQNGEIGKAIEGWAVEYKNIKDEHYLKNYIIGSLLVLEKENELGTKANVSSIKNSLIESIKVLFDTDKFRKTFTNRVNNLNNIKITREKVDKLKKEILQDIANFLNKKDKCLYIQFFQSIGVSSEEINEDKSVIKEMNILNAHLKSLGKYDLGRDLDILKSTINEIKISIKKLNNLGMSSDRGYIKIKDKISECLLDISIKLNNNYNNVDDAEDIMAFSKSIASSSLLKDRINKNEKIAEKNFKKIEIENFIDSIYISIESIKNPVFSDDYNSIILEISNIKGMIERIEKSGVIKENEFNRIRDDIGYAILSCGIDFNNRFGDAVKSEKLLELAKEFCKSTKLKEKLEKELNIVHSNASKQTEYNKNKYQSSGCLSVIIIIVLIVGTSLVI